MPEKSSQLYKRTKQNSVLTTEDLHNPQSNKNITQYVKKQEVWSLREKNQPLEDKSYKNKTGKKM